MKPAPFPEALKIALEQVGERVRHVLDMPTREQLKELTQRLDAIDARIEELEARRAKKR